MNTTTARSSAPDCLGLASQLVKLVSYCPEWQEIYTLEKQRILLALGFETLRLEHIGSTAVSGLRAKPIIDIMAGATSSAKSITTEAKLQTLGYEAKGESGIPGRLFFTFGDPCTFHLHLVQKGGAIWENHLRFRDKLRNDSVVAQDYQAVKQALAQKYPSDREAYTNGKAGFIEQVLETMEKPRTISPE